MTRSGFLTNLLLAPPLSGRQAILVGIVALAVPTWILSLDHALPAGACCTTYFPFVMFSAVMMGPSYASAVAVGSASLADALYMGPRFKIFDSPMDRFGDVTALVSFALVIGLAYLVRLAALRLLRLRDDVESSSGIIFSLERGQAWASWPGSAAVRLGPQSEVAEMMEDFLAQVELGKRLSEQYSQAH
jgi:hypothetical protein